jgi:catechol 2,3-dioxygenase-like lactoylglutathione lyase family enzyme
MSDPSFVILHVADPGASAPFYQATLGRPPVESSPTFVMFALASGVMLGLWKRDGVTPPATAPGGFELGIALPDDDAVRATHAAWRERRTPIAQEPTRLDFGFTFVALDPDGHRVRVFAPGAA